MARFCQFSYTYFCSDYYSVFGYYLVHDVHYGHHYGVYLGVAVSVYYGVFCAEVFSDYFVGRLFFLVSEEGCSDFYCFCFYSCFYFEVGHCFVSGYGYGAGYGSRYIHIYSVSDNGNSSSLNVGDTTVSPFAKNFFYYPFNIYFISKNGVVCLYSYFIYGCRLGMKVSCTYVKAEGSSARLDILSRDYEDFYF